MRYSIPKGRIRSLSPFECFGAGAGQEGIDLLDNCDLGFGVTVVTGGSIDVGFGKPRL